MILLPMSGVLSTEEEFFACLAQAGVRVRRRHSTINPLDVTGYAVGLPHHIAKDGQVIWYGGGKLAADLTLPKLRARWDSPPGGDRLAAASLLPASAIRAVLRATVATEAEQAESEADFFTRLRAAGLLVRERFSTINPGEVTGYAVALPDCTGSEGTLRWYAGGRLHDSLTLPRLRTAWARQQQEPAERSGAFRFTAPERTEIYRDAARRTASATEYVRRCTAEDPHRGADTAWQQRTRCTRRRGRCVARCCAARRPGTTGPPGHRSAARPREPGRETNCGQPRGCSR